MQSNWNQTVTHYGCFKRQRIKAEIETLFDKIIIDNVPSLEKCKKPESQSQRYVSYLSRPIKEDYFKAYSNPNGKGR